MGQKIDIHGFNIKAGLRSLRSWNIPSSVVSDIELFIEDLSMGKVNKGKRLTDLTCIKYLRMLKISLEYFNKSISRISLSDVESFDRSLSDGTLRTWKGSVYSDRSKVDIRVALKVFLTWKLGSRASKLVDWFDLRIKSKTPDFLSEREVSKLFKSCKDLKQRFLLAVLFDSGCRIEEFLNIRMEDVFLPEGSQNYVKIVLKEEYSKTDGRTISLYWPFTLEVVKDYYAQRLLEGARMEDPVYFANYDAVRIFLRRLGLRVLNKKVYPHLFRHSSATYYASKLNRQELCYRFGWKFSSDMPDVYISRAGMVSKDLDEKFKATQLEEVRKELIETKFQLNKEIDFLKGELREVLEAVHPVLVKVRSKLPRRQ